MNRWTCIDLFCGCGGFSLGMERAGFKCLAAIDFNHEAVEVFKNNFPAVPQVLKKDLTKFTPASLAKLIVQVRLIRLWEDRRVRVSAQRASVTGQIMVRG